MEPRLKPGYFAVITALIALPANAFAHADPSDSRAGATSALPHTPTHKISVEDDNEAPLYLSLSLSLSRPPGKGWVRPLKHFASPNEIDGELLFLPLSLSLSSLSIRPFIDENEVDETIQESDTASRESLFGDVEPAAKISPSTPIWKQLVTGWRGFSQLELADNYASPEHFSKAKLRTELSRTGQINEYLKWKISGRFDYDAAYDVSNFYPEAVRDNQRAQFFVRENYLDISAGNFDFRLGRQHVIWGEMVGLFFADVVSAKDLREFILPGSIYCAYRNGQCELNIPETTRTPRCCGYRCQPLMRLASLVLIIIRAHCEERPAFWAKIVPGAILPIPITGFDYRS